MFKIITALTLLTLSALAGTWLIEGTPTGIPAESFEETLRLDQTVQQTISNGTLKVEGQYIYAEAFAPSISDSYCYTPAIEPAGASIGGSFLNTSGTGFGNNSYTIYVDNYIYDGYNNYFCNYYMQGYTYLDGSSESAFSIVVRNDGYSTISSGYWDIQNSQFLQGQTGGILVTVLDNTTGIYYSKYFLDTETVIEITDPLWTGWEVGVNTSPSDTIYVGGYPPAYGIRSIYYYEPPGGCDTYNGPEQYYIYSKRIVNGQAFYSEEQYHNPPSPSSYSGYFTLHFTRTIGWYQDPTVDSYIVYDYAAGLWTEVLADGTDNYMQVVFGDSNWQNWTQYWLYPYNATPQSPLIAKPDIFLASNEAASVVINGDGQIVSTVSGPNTYAPLVVNSGVKVDNLNADSLDGYGGDAFVQSVSGTAPISVSAGKTPTVSHLDTNGYKHVPTNGTLNQILKNNGTGIASWGWVTEDKGVLSNVSLIVVNASNSVFNTRISRDTNGVLAMTENHAYADKGYHIKLNGSSIDLGGTVGGGDGSYNISANWWCKGPPTGATHRIFCNNGNSHYFQISTNVNGTHIDFVYNYYGYTKLNYSHPISSFSSGWNMLTVKKGYWGNSDETVRLYLNGTMISSLYTDTPNWYIDIRYVAGAVSSTYAPQYPIDEIAIWFGDYYKNISDTQITELYNVGRGGVPTYMGDYLASAGYYVTPAWPYTFQQPQYLFRFDTNDGPQARNAIGNTLYNFTSPGNAAYFEGEVCFKKVPKTQNLISCTGYPTGSVISVTTTIGDNNFNTVIAGSDIKLTPPRWQDTVVSGIALRAGSSSPSRELVTPDSGIYGTGFALNEDSDFAAQVQHGVASTNANFPNFYYNPHIHCSVSSVAAPEANATFVLIWQIAPVYSSFLGTSVSRTSTVSWAVSETNQHKLVTFGSITNNLLQGADSLIFRGNIKRITTPTLANDVPTKVIVDSLDYHFPFDSIGSTAIFGDAP
jgi:hypothetical protein